MAIAFGVIGWAAALLALPAGSVVALAVMAGVVGLAAAGTVPDPQNRSGRAEAARYMTWALRAAGGLVAVVGMLVVGGTGGLALTALLVVSSPAVVDRYRRRQQPRHPENLAASPSVRPERVHSATVPGPIVWPAPDTLTVQQLCLAWRASYTALQRAQTATDRALLVQVRAGYLDALEHHDSANFDRWLTSGARAAGDPARYLLRPPAPPQRSVADCTEADQQRHDEST
ncbi:hypothetical protein [Kribbella italica]|uniref:Uncharacterized protein n=1 Tax=Kribbella italica TaxID=1540520 RepID=A0A7W9J595_9ACTN|nr:hypothetical protein [Kribbella italica]MBB5835886.1 hypothetical protein [Kribbella italica]